MFIVIIIIIIIIVHHQSYLHATCISVGYYYFHRITHANGWRCVVTDSLTSIETLSTMKALALLCLGSLLVVVYLSGVVADWDSSSQDSDSDYGPGPTPIPGNVPGQGGWTPQRYSDCTVCFFRVICTFVFRLLSHFIIF